jgi:hypothetical protein
VSPLIFLFAESMQTKEMDWTRFNAVTAYEVWHQQLGHVPFLNIEQTIQHSLDLESLVGKKCLKDHKCSSCMIRKFFRIKGTRS